MKPVFRDLAAGSGQQWSAEDPKELIMYLMDQFNPLDDFLNEKGIPLRLEHDIYGGRDRDLLERVKILLEQEAS